MVTLERYKAAVQRLWTGKATVTVREGVLNEANGRTEPVERVLVEASPTRLSPPRSPLRRPPRQSKPLRSTLTPPWTSRRGQKSP